MSIDISLKCACCRSEVIDKNYTYNVRPMWKKARPEAIKMLDIDGMTGSDSIPILSSVIKNMEDNIGQYRDLNPSNGWGNADSFLRLIKELRAAAENYPDGVWEACR